MLENQRDGTEYRLVILGDGTVRTVPLRGDRWTIGRADDCSIVLRDPTVSRRHLQLEWNGTSFQFRDLGGSNPVSIDNKPAHAGEILPGQVITIGLTRLVIERRSAAMTITPDDQRTVVISREVADDEVPPTLQHPQAATAVRVLDRIEWTFADLGDLRDAAEPLLDLSRNLTSRSSGWIGRFTADGSIEALASHSVPGATSAARLPESMLSEACRSTRPYLVRTAEGSTTVDRLLVPLGKVGEGLMVLQQPQPGAPAGQELLRLAQSLGSVVWHRLQETTERLRLRDEVKRLRFHGTATHNALLLSNRLQSARQTLCGLVNSTEPIWLVGEEGTEREDLARYLHAESPRRAAVFVPWNAMQVPAWRHERDLFGDRREPGGLLQRVRGGTLFLDQIERLTAASQVRLLAELRKPAADGTAPPVLVASSLPTGIAQIDPALLEVLQAQRVEVPPLRHDSRDILALAELFLSELGSCPDGSPRLLTERAKRMLTEHNWPGNLRELRLVLEAAAAQASNQPIAPRHLPSTLGDGGASAPTPEVQTLEELERQHIVAVLKRTSGNRTRSAQLLGIATSTLYEKLKRYCLDG
jgi:transcriptional regulator with AAA-type ATPase domain/pSer/pThr/pTyr-binding forkhead associated (FHA) protein